MSKVWFVTGSSRGFGRAMVKAVLENGDKVIATARKTETLADLKKQYGDNIITPVLDVTDMKQTEVAVAEGLKTFGRIDNVVANAGYGNMATIEDTTMEDFQQQYDVLLFGVVRTVKAVLPTLRKQKSGHVFIVSSLGGRITSPALSAYQSAKWAASGFGEALHQEVSPIGIKVTVIEPSSMRTDGSSMSVIKPAQKEYAHVVRIIDMMSRSSGKETGDIAKIAKTVIALSKANKVPVRLLLGKDALQYATAIESHRTAENERWAHLTNSIEYEG